MNIKLDANETHTILSCMNVAQIQGKDAIKFGKILMKLENHFQKVTEKQNG